MEYKILKDSMYHKIIDISPTEIGKIATVPKLAFYNVETGEQATEALNINVHDEMKHLCYANSINDLIVKFIRMEKFKEFDMIVLERLYPIPYNSFTKQIRKKFYEDLKERLRELHINGFAHGDIRHPVIRTVECFDNIILTEEGFRLIDAGFSKIREKISPKEDFYDCAIQDYRELLEFGEYFLNL